MIAKPYWLAAILLSTLTGCETATVEAQSRTLLNSAMVTHTLENPWYQAAAASVKNKPLGQAERGKAKNIILFVGDGMGVSTVTAARILAGQQQGKLGEEHQLSFELFPYSGLSKTYNVNAQVPDSAGTMTAIISGLKTDTGVLGVSEEIDNGECPSQAGNEVFSALELAEIAGKATGIISTARITHATPAATFAKSADRDWEADSDLSDDAKAAGCEDIASQLIHFEPLLRKRIPNINIDGIDLVMGGGRRNFLAKQAKGKRTDGRDLSAEWQQQYPSGKYITDKAGFDAIDTTAPQKILALFNSSHMEYEADRDHSAAGEPSLSEMTETAIKLLQHHKSGYFLMVEGGRIDHGHHAGSAYSALTETIEMSNAVAKAAELSNSDDTLIIVTADHSHVLTIAGYPKRGNPILGKVISVGSKRPSLADDGLPYTTLGYQNGLGFRNLGDELNADMAYDKDPDTGRRDLSKVDTESSGFHQEALVAMGSETHGGEDVAIYARGPGAALVSGSNEQNVIFHVMEYAADLLNKAQQALSVSDTQ
ncbi:MAG: alkaline phosphatase [Zhongshania sp.]|jgi:alkaline phosphatase